MEIPVPDWAKRALGMPGAVSFRRLERRARAAAALADEVRALRDDALRAAAAQEAARLGWARAAEVTPRLLALLREAAARALSLTPFDTQLVACGALLTGHVVELDTGEGKTLVGALAAAGHALAGRGVHVLSVNDYLAERDATWMAPLFALLGVSVGWTGQHTPYDERRRVYRCDVAYAPVSEIGFDVLRDRFAVTATERVDPVFDVAIVDEADAVMIDEAMVPLVLAGASEHDGDDLAEATMLVGDLAHGTDFTVDADQATVTLSDAGLDRLEARLGGINLYDTAHLATLTRINLALHARTLVHRDVDYLVADDGIRLINASRGRVAHRQRWPDGLHAAIEAKEGIEVSAPGVVLDTVTIQDLLLEYRTLSGMSGTVLAVAEELIEFFRLPAARVDRHRPNVRVDLADRVLSTETDAAAAAVAEIAARHRTGQPVLAGTQSVAASESLAAALHRTGIESRVLNAKNDADEAAIVARAGEHGAVTISTQMSGRGTDIRLGGADESDRTRVVAAGGLAVVQVGRFPSRRLDAQLRGRAGRQGDPGTTIAFASLDADLVQAHAPTYLLARIDRRGDRLPDEARRRIVDAAQRISEGLRRDRHRATWQYSRAISRQRAVVLARRAEIAGAAAAGGAAALDLLRPLIPDELAALERARGGAVADTVRAVVLFHLDEGWTQHLALLQEVRDGIHLRALAAQKPAEEFHRIALVEFHGFFDAVARDAAAFVAGLVPDDIGRRLDDLGLRRPSATWTYMVTDDPFGAPGDRLTRRAGAAFRSRVLRME